MAIYNTQASQEQQHTLVQPGAGIQLVQNL